MRELLNPCCARTILSQKPARTSRLVRQESVGTLPGRQLSENLHHRWGRLHWLEFYPPCALARRRHSVVNFDKLTYAGNLANLQSVAGHPRYRFVKGDICDPDAVTQAMAGCEVVVHFAAESHVDRSIYEPAPVIQTNVTGTFVLLQVARTLNVQRFLHISTDEVYGDLPPGAVADENFPLQPSSPYSASKAAADLLVRSFVRTYRFPALITRSSNNYGPYQFPEKFLPLMIANALANKPLPVYGDGRQQRELAARRGQLPRPPGGS